MATTASEPTTWRAGAASVLSEAVGAADVVGAGVGAGVEVGAEDNVGAYVGAGVGQIYIFTTPHDVDSHRVPENALDG